MLLIAHEFGDGFQTAVVHAGGPVQFLTRPWDFRAVADKVRAMLAVPTSSLRHWVVRLPVATP